MIIIITYHRNSSIGKYYLLACIPSECVFHSMLINRLITQHSLNEKSINGIHPKQMARGKKIVYSSTPNWSLQYPGHINVELAR